MTIMLTLALTLLHPTIDCGDPQTQSAMNACAMMEYEATDGALNAEWDKTVAHVKAMDVDDPAEDGAPSRYDALLKAQRAWIAFRDAHCHSEAMQYRGGSIAPLIYATCLNEVTERRIEQLRAFREEG